LGSARTKAASKTLVKSTPAANFINIYGCIFRTKFWGQSQNVTRKASKKDIHTKKARQKTMMKLTAGVCTVRFKFWHCCSIIITLSRANYAKTVSSPKMALKED